MYCRMSFGGHSGFFHAADDAQPLEVGVPEHADAPGGALHKGQQALLVIIAQGGGGDLQHAGCLANGIDHKNSSK